VPAFLKGAFELVELSRKDGDDAHRHGPLYFMPEKKGWYRKL
jgi:hypothetical protein